MDPAGGAAGWADAGGSSPSDPRMPTLPFKLNQDRLCGAGEWLIEKHGTKTRRSCRFKQVTGDKRRSRTDRRRATGVDVAVHALNRMLELGRPNSVRIA